MKQFDKEELKEGYILQVRHLRFGFGQLIQKILNSWAGHDALIVRQSDGTLGVGDTRPFCARVTTLEWYEKEVESGNVELRILAPKDYALSDGNRASAWWLDHENGVWYDFISYPRLLLKALFGDDWNWAKDMKWDWCTEGCMDAWLDGAQKDYWRKQGYIGKIQPTPLTTQHRMNEGIFVDKTSSCFKET